MQLSEAGQVRIRGYLYVLERSLRTFLPSNVVADAVTEVESHIRERASQLEPVPDERAALERVLRELGPPLQVAQAYSLELSVDEAVATGRVVSVARALWHVATTTIGGFLAAVLVLWGYLAGFVFLLTAALKPFFPRNIVFDFKFGFLPLIRGSFPNPPEGPDPGGLWVVPFALACGLGVLVATHRGAKKWLAWWIARRRALRLRLINVTPPESS